MLFSQSLNIMNVVNSACDWPKRHLSDFKQTKRTRVNAARTREENTEPKLSLGPPLLFSLRLIPTHRAILNGQPVMSVREQQLEAECQMLRSELAAMEQLVERYQDELADVRGAAPCYRHRRMNAPDLYRVEEELFENQNLAPRGSTMRVTRAELPVLSRANGEETRFSEVVLPTANWEWVSDWICDIHAHTDERGWAYASSWEQLRDASQLHRSERTMEVCVRQRRWKRERMLVHSTGLPSPLNASLLHKSRLAAMQYASGKLSQQLLRANERIGELEQQTRVYEAHMIQLQELVQSLSKDLYARSFDLSEPVAVPYAVLKSAELLKQTEDLLDDILVEQGAARLDALAANSEVQRRRSEMVAECQKELKWTVDEFHDLAHTLERRQSPPP